MFAELFASLSKPLTGRIRTEHVSVPNPDGRDGACPTCDYPFAELNHMCLGGALAS
jgi:hypothetical protein